MPPPMPPAQIQWYEEHASDNRQPGLIAMLVCSLAITYPAVALRFWAKKLSATKVGLDDWLIALALLPLTGYTALEAVGVYLGVGKHIIFLKNPNLFFPTWVAQIPLYAVCVTLTKVSILCFYNRIFRSKGLNRLSWVVGVIVAAYNFTLIMTTMLECIPLQSLWNGKPGKCFNVLPSWIVLAIVNVVTDAMILGLPIRHVFRLQMRPTRKLQVCGIFLTGAIVCVFGVIRCVALSTFSPMDMTYAVVPSAKWSLAEITVGIVAACLPTMGNLFSKAKSKLSSAGESSYRKANGKWDNASPHSTPHSSRKAGGGDVKLENWTNYQKDSNSSRETLTRNQSDIYTFVNTAAPGSEQNVDASTPRDNTTGNIMVKHELHQF